MHCYNSPNYNYNYYNNGQWENSCGCGVDVQNSPSSQNICNRPSNYSNCQRITYVSVACCIRQSFLCFSNCYHHSFLYYLIYLY